MKMLHTCYRVKDLEASLNFYKEALSFEERSYRDFPDDGFTLVYLAYPGEQHELELTYNYGHPGYEIGNGYSHIAVGTEDLEGLHAKHKAAGYKVTDLYGLPGTPPSYYFITDPDGYDIEVVRI
ncbi:MAG: VOC family protein [Defluviitaleaceae bacterium]|nr:VOC family protein [Defluviitaleaceae bacterium]